MAENNEHFVLSLEDVTTMPIGRGRKGICLQGLRAFCLKHGYSYEKFQREGICTSELEGIHDAMMKHVVAHARKRREG